MAPRYPVITALVGAALGLAASAGTWPGALTVGPDVGWPSVLLAVLTGFVIAWRSIDERERHAPTALIGIAGTGFIALGTFAYWAYLVGNIDGLAGALGSILGGSVILTAAIADWYAIPTADARRRLRAVGIGTVVGLAGLVSMILWQFILLLGGLSVLGRELAETELIAVSALSLGLGMGSVAFLYLRGSSRGPAFIDLKWPSLSDVGWIIGGTVGVFVALIGISLLMQALGTPMPEHGIVEVAMEGDPFILLLLVPASLLIIGPGEELLFRNIIQKSLYDHFSRPASVFVASLLFGLAHFPAYGGSPDSIGPMLIIFALSLLLGAVYARTENILVPAVIHGLYNAIQFLSLYVELTANEETAWLLLNLL